MMAGQRKALIVANGDDDNAGLRRLRSPVADADALAEVLSDRQIGDSCHGLKSESGELFFAARNTRPDRLGSTAVPAEFVQRCMRMSRSHNIILMLDCCYGGAFGR